MTFSSGREKKATTTYYDKKKQKKTETEVLDKWLFCLDRFLELSYIMKNMNHIKILFVLRFYGPVNPMGSCRAPSVYITTRLLGRLSPLSG